MPATEQLPTDVKTAELNATDKIRRGLDAASARDPFESVTPGQALPNVGELEGLVKSHIELYKSIEAFVGDLESQVQRVRAERLAEIDGEMSDLVVHSPSLGSAGPSAKSIDDVTKARRLKAETDIRELRVGLTQAHDATVSERINRLNVAEQRLSQFAATFPNELSYLMAQGLADPARTTYHANVAHAGANELTALAKLAIQTQNRPLAAAVAARVGQLPAKDRPFEPIRIAQAVVGKEYGDYTAAAVTLRSLTQAALNGMRNFREGRALGKDSHQKIADGLAATANLTTVQPNAQTLHDLAGRPRNTDGTFAAKQQTSAPSPHPQTGVKGSGKWDTLPATRTEADARAAAEAAAAAKETQTE